MFVCACAGLTDAPRGVFVPLGRKGGEMSPSCGAPVGYRPVLEVFCTMCVTVAADGDFFVLQYILACSHK